MEESLVKCRTSFAILAAIMCNEMVQQPYVNPATREGRETKTGVKEQNRRKKI